MLEEDDTYREALAIVEKYKKLDMETSLTEPIVKKWEHEPGTTTPKQTKWDQDAARGTPNRMKYADQAGDARGTPSSRTKWDDVKQREEENWGEDQSSTNHHPPQQQTAWEADYITRANARYEYHTCLTKGCPSRARESHTHII